MAFDLNNKEFIERVLHTRIKDYKIGEGCKKGDNVAGSLKSIVATTESGETISAVIKTFPPKDSEMVEQMKEGQVFRAECDAYTVLAKDIEELVDTLSGPTEKGRYTVPLPLLYDHFNDDENDYICLEDVRPQGYIMPNVFKGLTYPECSLILEELARFHAYSYALIRQEGEKLFGTSGRLARFDYRVNMINSLQQWMGMISASVGTAIDLMQGINPSLAKVMQENIPVEKTIRFMDAFLSLTDVKIFPCLVHGDFWSNNVLIKYEEQLDSSKKPVAVKFIDFQFSHRGNVFEDLIYFIFTSTDTQFRKKYLHRVLADYYSAFKNALDIINVPMPINFTLGFLVDTFIGSFKGGLVYMCFAIPFQLGKHNEEPEPQDQLQTESKEENKDAANAPDPTQTYLLGLRKMMENSPPALKRLEEITKEVLLPEKY